MTRIAINGFGRIGRATLRAIVERDETDITVVAINDLAEPEILEHLLKYDSVYGRLHAEVRRDHHTLYIGDRAIALLSEKNPAFLPWNDLGVEVVIECTGKFSSAQVASIHLDAGAKKVIVSAPSRGADFTLVHGVNSSEYLPEKHHIISNASCTTNALAPIASVLDRIATITYGSVSTVHAYTQDQTLLDSQHQDLRRARAAAINIVPTSTGAASAIGAVLPQLKGKMNGSALRVPVEGGSIVELHATVEHPIARETVLEHLRQTANTTMNGVLSVTDEPLVSKDIIGNPHSSIVDAGLLHSFREHVKISAWYDNEWGFSNRLVDAVDLIST